ncbi:MAG: SAM-dependent methyltransferase [Lachnospiraceae bacterium]|nr:SAM-dependent methyltransferase [Lachnospiraceae bacterium]
MENLTKKINNYIENNEKILTMIASNPRDREKIQKLKIRPVLKKEELWYQAESFVGTKVFHKNIPANELADFIADAMKNDFKQLEAKTERHSLTVLVSKKGKVTTKEKVAAVSSADAQLLSHNRTKQYILPQDKPVPFLVELGVQTPDGKIVNAKYDKFRQINRYLEFVRDILPALAYEEGKTLNIIDFGCGKSYLTFALYYYLKVMNKYDIRVTGLDLKKDVIAKCQALADKFGYDGLKFLVGDIGAYEGATQVDMVVTLHACDTATDYALAKAVQWNAKVILSVPCCQHELNRQIKCPELAPVLKYGIIKERMAALMTDAIRANLLESQGYDTQLLEFIDMENTPKNLLIRAVKKERMRYKAADTQLKELEQFLNIRPTLETLLTEDIYEKFDQ